MAPSNSRYAFAALMAGNVCLSFGPLLVRLADVGPMASAFWRLMIALPILGLLPRLTRQPMPRDRRILAILFIGGLFFALDLASWHYGILRTRLANATLFGNVSSFVFAAYGFAIARTWPGRNQWAAMLLAALGVMLLLGRSYELSPRNFVGDLLCILAGLFYTGYLIVVSHTRGTVASWPALFFCSLGGVVPLYLAVLAMGVPLVPGDWTPLILLACGSQIAGQGLMVYAIGHLSPLVVGLGLLAQPVMAALIGWIGYGERLSVGDVVGAVAIAVALVLVRLPARRRLTVEPAE